MTLRRRLIGSYILVALVGLLLASIAGAVLVRGAQVRAAEGSVRLITRIVNSRAAPAVLRPTNPELLALVGAFEGKVFLVRDGTIVESNDEALVGDTLPVRPALLVQAAGQRRPPIFQARLAGQPHFLSVLPREGGPNGGNLVIAIPTATLLDSWLRLLPAILLLSVFGTAVAGAVGWRVSGSLTAPVEALTEAANLMAAGDYETRVESVGDVVEIQGLARSFNSMAAEVKEARQTQRDFLANVSHDLRTPLTSIQGFSQAMMDGAVPEDQTPRVAGIIHTEAARLSRLVQDLLDLARIEAGRFSMVQRDIDLQTVLERCSDKFRPQAQSMGVALDIELPRRALPVHGDADRLEQVVTNLIDNALTYAQDGGGHVRLVGALGGIRGTPAKKEPNGSTAPLDGSQPAEGVEEEGNDPTKKLGRWWIEIKVEDDGPGISDEQKPLVFERFHRADRARGGGSLGLGLAIAREIVEAHGGDITIEDGVERGAQFVVRLPMKMR